MSDVPCSRCGLRPKPIRRIDQPSPYAAYIDGTSLGEDPDATPSTRDEIEAFIDKMENELLDCDADIAHVEEALRLLRQQREAGESLIARHRSILSRLHSLPPEIMLEIFRNCLDEDLGLDRPGYSLGPGLELPTPWVLSAVCRRWRNILRQSPSYWSTFELVLRHLQPLHLTDALALSGQAPLRFYLNLDISWKDFQALAKHLSRWEAIHISGTSNAFVSFGHLGRLPILKKLCITLRATWNAGRDEFREPDDIMDFTAVLSPFSDCPQLNELNIKMDEDVWVDQSVFYTTSLPIPWLNLSKLTVRLELHLSHIIRSLLLACANLRQLDVQGFSDVDPTIDVPFEPLLIQSGVTSLTLNNAFYLLEHIEFSTLTHLPIQGALWDLLPFISKHRRSILHVELSLVTFFQSSEGDWDSAAYVLSNLIHFTAHLYSMSSHSLNFLSHFLGPKLRTLTIYPQFHLLEFCKCTDILPLIACWSARTLQTLEIYPVRTMDRSFFTDNPVYSTLQKADLTNVVSKMIEDSDVIKALRGFKEEGLEVSINDIPLSNQSALLYM